VLKQKLD